MFKKLCLYYYILLSPGYFFGIDNRVELSILTEPIGHGGSRYGGHVAVTRSLVEGLQKINAIFNYNPKTVDDVGNIVIVLSNIEALDQAIQLKKEGKIRKIFAGPNLMVRSNEHNGILASPEVDVCIVPSEWVKNIYIEDEPSLQDRIQVWFAGVNTNHWSPSKNFSQKSIDKYKKVLVYWKTEPESFCVDVERTLRKHGWQTVRLEYGRHSNHQYKHILETVLFSVFLSRTESQGIALAESWAMDVPTLVWDPQEPRVISNKTCWPVSAAPYITNQTGLIWTTRTELEGILNTIERYISSFSPRAWVERNMSDEVSAQFLVDMMHDKNQKISE